MNGWSGEMRRLTVAFPKILSCGTRFSQLPWHVSITLSKYHWHALNLFLGVRRYDPAKEILPGHAVQTDEEIGAI